MKPFAFIKRYRSVRGKLILIIMTTCLLVLFLASAAFIVYDSYRSRQDMLQDLTAIGMLIADRSTAALLFDDSRLAGENLSALRVKPSVEAACIYGASGSVFAVYKTGTGREVSWPPVKSERGYRFERERLRLFEPIISDGKRVGTLYISTSLAELYAKQRNTMVLVVGIVLLSTVAAWFLSSRFQQYVSEPLKHLTETAQRITQQNDYSVRATKSSDDEIGTLVTAFNEMLETISAKNRELEQHRGHLEELVVRRTAALQTSQENLINTVEDLNSKKEELEAANRKLLEVDHLKSLFIASMSHELRTPLNSIIGFTGILLQGLAGELNSEQRKQLGMVKSSSEHLLSLITDIIDLSKIEAGKIDLSLEEFDLVGVVNEVLGSFQIIAERKALALAAEMPTSLMLVSDKRRVRQVLVNLVGNAMKFTEQGGVTVTAQEKDGVLAVAVRDTGMGIKAEDLGRLFKSFSQVTTVEAPKHEGSGLGLYLSRRLVTLLGGEIGVESEFGKGSVFFFTMPIKR